MNNKKENISNLLKRAKLYGLPEEVLRKIIIRDKNCVFCGIQMKICSSSIGTPKNKATIEHFNYKASWGESVDVGMCCGSCNSSKSNKKLLDWLKTDYCIKKNVNEKTVAKPVKNYIKKIRNNI